MLKRIFEVFVNISHNSRGYRLLFFNLAIKKTVYIFKNILTAVYLRLVKSHLVIQIAVEAIRNHFADQFIYPVS
jgi:hypothetical protein